MKLNEHSSKKAKEGRKWIHDILILTLFWIELNWIRPEQKTPSS
jgi:hypothetical protein